ncbi:chorismate--pyruvate lyase family protein [Alteromonas ponticola]|uniref:Probable chorismate pyruvate-lyase n=1 Tax=Alteromonas ponticola TaxID=2720613 RepID=A0ABX1R2G3_9ALTE|nr:chorismate lyase [Alteromonas ponticola]NMH59821.1 chorismate lyase [Alteromonas ponticola]
MLNNLSFPVGLDVEWVYADRVSIPNSYLKNWLLDTGSLTERLQSMSRHFALQKLGQAEQMLHKCEREWLSKEEVSRWYVREVVLFGDQQPWVFARSVIPHQLVEGELANIGSQPLGKIIFNDQRFTRSKFQLCKIDSHQLTSLCAAQQHRTLWGRRSKFTFNDVNMLVAEVFLPQAPAYLTGNTDAC